MYPGAHATTQPDKPAYVMASTGRVITYRELDEEANRLSQLFRAAGLRPGDHMAFCMENHPKFLAIAWGAQYAGLYYTAISSRLTSEEVEYIVNDCGAKVFITSQYKAEAAEHLVDRMPNVSVRLVLDGPLEGYEPYEEVVGRYPAEPLADRVAGKDMLYSSGTTGRPKGVKPAFPSEPIDQPTAVTGLMQLLFQADPSMVYLSPAPLYHAAPLRFTMAVHQIGGTAVIMEHFDAEEALALIERYRVTHSQWVPTMFVRMLKLPEEVRNRYDVSSMRVAIHAAAPCPVPVKRQMIEWWGPVIHEYYAATEGNGFVYCNSEDWLAHPGTVGRPLLGEVHIVGEDGEEVPVGEEGTIYFSGGNDFEYHNDPEKTAQSRNDRGWTTLGDVGRVDEDGFLYLTDRKSYMIITGGVNVYPQETENLLVTHPKVLDCAVIGVPNEDFGEEVKAVVQLADGIEPGPELEQELIAFCREHLADVKCPRSVDFVDELPRHPTGKLYKRLLRDRYWAGHESRII
ncbi:acyl-CoA synthetase [Rhabdothermincola sediminis]|uniref:acyl-CoA synthetase n=1 Tax=Rhabdothermincola sediminis TaxID=2751370 RepID=UPI0027DA42F2|nr:acyl-CoA synthetase [Rhabdothermincola sediminis]